MEDNDLDLDFTKKIKSSLNKIKKKKIKDGKAVKVSSLKEEKKEESSKPEKPLTNIKEKVKAPKVAKEKVKVAKEKVKVAKEKVKAPKAAKEKVRNKAFVAPVFKNKKEAALYLKEALKKDPKIVSSWLEKNRAKLGKAPFVPAKVEGGSNSKDSFVEALFNEKFLEFSHRFKVSSLGRKDLNKEASSDIKTLNILALSAFLS